MQLSNDVVVAVVLAAAVDVDVDVANVVVCGLKDALLRSWRFQGLWNMGSVLCGLSSE